MAQSGQPATVRNPGHTHSKDIRDDGIFKPDRGERLRRSRYRHRNALDRLRPRQRAPWKGLPAGALLVRRELPALHTGAGIRRSRNGFVTVVDDRRGTFRHRLRHTVHGVPRDAGPGSRTATDDSVTRAVRVPRRAAASDRHVVHVRRVQCRRHRDHQGWTRVDLRMELRARRRGDLARRGGSGHLWTRSAAQVIPYSVLGIAAAVDHPDHPESSQAVCMAR